MSAYAKILLVEDDIALAEWVVDYLESEGFSLTHLDNGNDVESELKSSNVDLILLDVMLPGLNGIEVCKKVRAFSQVPIIMLTARVDEIDEVIGLEVGANDYITKPARPRALLARIKAVLKHTANHLQNTSSELVFGALTIDKSAKRVTLEGETIGLTTSLFEFLCLLADNAGHVVSRETVFQELKSREYDGFDRRYDVMVSTLRKLLHDKDSERIKTVWGQGYLFISDAWQSTQ